MDNIWVQKASTCKFRKINIKHTFQPQCYEPWNQLQGKTTTTTAKKTHKHKETRKYATKQPMNHWRNQIGNQKIPRDI